MSPRPTAPSPSPTGPANAAPVINGNADAKAKREQAEQKEVAGRHKNDGQKPHKGAR